MSRDYINAHGAIVTIHPRFDTVYPIILCVIVINKQYDKMIYFYFCSYRTCLNDGLSRWPFRTMSSDRGGFTRVSLGTFVVRSFPIIASTQFQNRPKTPPPPFSPNEPWDPGAYCPSFIQRRLPPQRP